MSQSTLPGEPPAAIREQVERQPVTKPTLPASVDAAYELDYQPMPVMAPVALFLGIAAFSALMGLFGLVLAAVGILVSLGSFLQIKASKGYYSGTKLSVIGGVLSASFLTLGVWMMISDYHAELPPGYTRVNFPREIAEKEFVEVEGRRELHPDVKPFVDQPIFLKGYIWQSQTYDSGFILLKDNGECCFGGSPAAYDMIEVRLQTGQPFNYISGLVSVAGTFRANPHALPGQAVYVMEAKHVAPAKTVF